MREEDQAKQTKFIIWEPLIARRRLHVLSTPQLSRGMDGGHPLLACGLHGVHAIAVAL
jgi:hypothetical protein